MDLSIKSVLYDDPSLTTKEGYIFKPTEKECQEGLLHICYSSAVDSYIRPSSEDQRLNSWQKYTYSYTNFFRKHEWDWGMTYLARHECRGYPFAAEVTWKFDVAETDKKISMLELQAPCALYEDGVIIWTICTDKQNFVQTDSSLNKLVTFELEKSTTLTITAFLTGGRGSCAYQHAQLFRQEKRDQSTYPFQVKLYLESPAADAGISTATPDDIEEVENCYVFTPNKGECERKSIDITYKPSEDCYFRLVTNEKLLSLKAYTYSCTNVALMTDGESLGAKEDLYFGRVTWKFDTTDTGLQMKELRLRAPTYVKNLDSVVFVICSGQQCYMETGYALDMYMTFDLEGSTDLSITVFFKEGDKEALLSQIDIELKLCESDGKETATAEIVANTVEVSSDTSLGSNTGFTFKPTEEEITEKVMHICYSSNDDKYIRKVSSNELYNWQSCTNSWNNILRKEDNYKWMTYLISEDSYNQAEVTWKFDVTDTDLKIRKLELRATTTVFEPSIILWTISTGKQTYKVESLQNLKTFDLHNSSTLTITAHSEGNQGPNASQLFPQPLDDGGDLPFEVKVHLAHPTYTDASIDATKWRFPKESFGIPAPICAKVDKCYVFKPTRKDCKNRMMRVSYSPRTDKYKTGTPSGDEITSWLDGTYSSINMYRKEEYDHDMTYLARIEGTQFADVTWKFDVTGTNVDMDKLELKAYTRLYEDARILWTIRAGDKTFIKTANYLREHSQSFDLGGASTLTISAFLTGGKGLVAWQHSQLFRENMYDEDEPPFDVSISFNERIVEIAPEQSCVKGKLGLPALTYQQYDADFVFEPTASEIEKGEIHIVYNVQEDCYIRKPSIETQSSWLDYTNSSTNVAYRKEGEYGDMPACLGRMDDAQFAEVTWKFDLTDHGIEMSKLEMKAISTMLEDGCIIWTIKTDDQKFIQTGPSLCEMMVFDLKGSQTLSITVFLAGGIGEGSAKHTQLFSKEEDDELADFPFDLKVFLQPKTD